MRLAKLRQQGGDHQALGAQVDRAQQRMPGNRGSFAGRGLHCCCGRSFGFDNLWPKRFEGGSHWCAGGGAA
jgi:hypothetical protein